MSMRSFEDILKRLQESKEYHVCFLTLLENIKINRKKDGTHFKNKNQTFENAEYTGNIDGTITHPKLKIHGRDKFGVWQRYEIDCYIYLDTLPKDDKRREGRETVTSCLRNTYLLTTDEIIERIEEEKKRQKKYIENYDKQIDKSPQIFQKVNDKVKELKDVISSECEELRDNPFKSTLEYALIDYVKYML